MKILNNLFKFLFVKNNEFSYVYVEIDGSVRELDNEEKKYLSEKFHPNDGGRPYIKNSYYQTTPDNKINGFLKRSKISKEQKNNLKRTL